MKEKYCLISVSDKSNLEKFASFLSSIGYKIISTGGTAKFLRENNIEVIDVSEITKFQEILDGRVKTLHPNLHAGILARNKDQAVLENLNIKRINLVVANFYPFSEVVNRKHSYEEAIENIDIGGPTLVRAAAKNFLETTIITSSSDFEKATISYDQEKDEFPLALRKEFAIKAFQKVTEYDTQISNYLNQSKNPDTMPERINLNLQISKSLRYGENPHQNASIYSINNHQKDSLKLLLGKEISYNNYVDSYTALKCIKDFNEPTCVIIKHANPCGISSNKSLINAYKNSYLTDPTSAFGGVIALNNTVEKDLITEIYSNQFVEIILAPEFTEDAIKEAKKKPNVRIIKYSIEDNNSSLYKYDMKLLDDKFLIQECNSIIGINDYRVVSKIKPNDDILEDIFFTWKVCKHVKSNAIVFAKNKSTLGIGAGQPSRIDSTNIAINKAKNFGYSLKNSIMASDAFFPFRDNVDKAAEEKVTAIIHPGGSKNDDEVIEAANEHNIILIFTGIRHFNH